MESCMAFIVVTVISISICMRVVSKKKFPLHLDTSIHAVQRLTLFVHAHALVYQPLYFLHMY